MRLIREYINSSTIVCHDEKFRRKELFKESKLSSLSFPPRFSTRIERIVLIFSKTGRDATHPRGQNVGKYLPTAQWHRRGRRERGHAPPRWIPIRWLILIYKERAIRNEKRISPAISTIHRSRPMIIFCIFIFRFVPESFRSSCIVEKLEGSMNTTFASSVFPFSFFLSFFLFASSIIDIERFTLFLNYLFNFSKFILWETRKKIVYNILNIT